MKHQNLARRKFDKSNEKHLNDHKNGSSNLLYIYKHIHIYYRYIYTLLTRFPWYFITMPKKLHSPKIPELKLTNFFAEDFTNHDSKKFTTKQSGCTTGMDNLEEDSSQLQV